MLLPSLNVYTYLSLLTHVIAQQFLNPLLLLSATHMMMKMPEKMAAFCMTAMSVTIFAIFSCSVSADPDLLQDVCVADLPSVISQLLFHFPFFFRLGDEQSEEAGHGSQLLVNIFPQEIVGWLILSRL